MKGKAPPTLKSGELAKLLGLSITTIHDNIKGGFFTEPNKTPGGHRRFSVDVVIADYRTAGRKAPAALIDYKKRLAGSAGKVGRAAVVPS